MKTGGLLAAALLAASFVAGCSGGDDDDADAAATTTAGAGASSTATTAPAVLHVLVSNDDGYQAPGIAVLVDALNQLPGVEVVVVAPDGNRSGTGGQTTPGGTTATDVTMANGFAAVAVAGFPADAITYALDVIGVTPDLVVSGANFGQNLGPVVDVSGTVGAARAAAQRGIPAVAVSAGLGTPEPDYQAAVDAAVGWIVEHRGDLAGATGGEVVNINVPTCATGEPSELVEVPLAVDEADRNVAAADIACAPTEGTVPADDVDAFNAGYAVLSLVSPQPG